MQRCIAVVALLFAVGSFAVGSFAVGSVLAATPASPTPRPGREAGGWATRVVVPVLGIDLPVVSGGLVVEGNEPGYPLCDVAQYLEEFEDPGQLGATYIYAHARKGMFAPLLAASRIDNGRSLLGLNVLVYTNDALLYTYQIFLVKRHTTDFSLAREVPPGERRLVLQTSEGPRGTIPVLQVAARLVSTASAPADDAHPVARPRVCVDPLPPLVAKRELAAAAAGLVAVLAVAWWIRKKKRRGRSPGTLPA